MRAVSIFRVTAALLMAAIVSTTMSCAGQRRAADGSISRIPGSGAVRALRDSVRVTDIRYDSVYIFRDRLTDRKADTVFLHDNRVEYRYRLLRDTVRLVRTDSIPYPVTVTEVRQVPRPRGALDVAAYCCLGLVAGALAWRVLRAVKKG